MRHLLTEVTEEEYGYALAHHAHSCRPFAAAMGDHRSAARCIADYPVRTIYSMIVVVVAVVVRAVEVTTMTMIQEYIDKE